MISRRVRAAHTTHPAQGFRPTDVGTKAEDREGLTAVSGYVEPTMADRSEIEAKLEALRFDEAEELAAEADPEMQDEIARRRTEAIEQAQALSSRINDLGADRAMEELARLVEDLTTRPLLDLLPASPRRRAESHLRGAERWIARQREVHTRRLGEMRRATDSLDLELARGLAKRIDSRFLTDDQTDTFDQILLEVSAREMELESLEASGRQLFEEAERDARDDDRPWWRRLLG